jgi:beta-aspartyl-peptidase (threonine type)
MYTIAIHGGAGVINPGALTSAEENQYREALGEALLSGYRMLERGVSALDAVEAAVMSLEDNPLFNAGKGSVFNSDGIHEMEASVMWGKNLDAGAVCAVRNIRNPVHLARLAMEKSPHLFLNGTGAEDFAREHGLTFEDDSYFFTTKRYDQLLDAKKNSKVLLDHAGEHKFGTVGAVAMDQHGNLAAATSTGGLANKSFARIGDTPVIGSGTYANNNTCAVSCTGEGEFFIRGVTAYDISCLMEYKGLSLQEACDLVIMKKMKDLGGEGGVIAVDNKGNVALVFNSEGMYRAYKQEGSDPVIAIAG